MKKFIKEITVSSRTDIGYNINIDEFILWLGEQKNLGATHINLNVDQDYEIEVESCYNQEESDEEYNIRMMEANRIKQISIMIKEDRDKEEYARLRLKYGMGFGY